MSAFWHETRKGAWHYVTDVYGMNPCEYASIQQFEKMCRDCYPHGEPVCLSRGTDRNGRVVARNQDGTVVLIQCIGRACDYCHIRLAIKFH
jgi:hypothetical protein